MQSTEIEPMLTAEELGKMLNVKTGTLTMWRQRHEGPRWYQIGGSIRYRRSDVETWLASQVREPRAADSASA